MSFYDCDCFNCNIFTYSRGKEIKFGNHKDTWFQPETTWKYIQFTNFKILAGKGKQNLDVCHRTNH
jgi:hypothetical protein